MAGAAARTQASSALCRSSVGAMRRSRAISHRGRGRRPTLGVAGGVAADGSVAVERKRRSLRGELEVVQRREATAVDHGCAFGLQVDADAAPC
jgi:hypothetical protein